MIHPARIQPLNDSQVAIDGRYVLYWMQASQRVAHNPAMEFAIDRANELKLPVLVGFGLMDDYPEANERHYAFMIEGLADVRHDLAARGIGFIVRKGNPAAVAIQLAHDAAMVICDRGYLRHQKLWRREVARHAGRKVIQVESDVVVPVEQASNKAESAARTLRPRIHRYWQEHLVPLKAIKPAVASMDLDVRGDVDPSDVGGALAGLKIDRSVGRVHWIKGGHHAGRRALGRFIRNKLCDYDEGRNDPAGGGTSLLAAYLHFGQMSPVEIALAVQGADCPTGDRDAFMEQLIVRRELAMNFVNFTENYDRYSCLPAWARRTLEDHAKDKRPYLYSLEQLEQARTHDRYWNAAQRQMVVTGFMHGYMRMYWGKMVLQWKRNARQALSDLIYLNNKYFLCGRDPNAYANVGWIFGLHDRPWPGRPIYGAVRSMAASGLERKFNMEEYLHQTQSLG